MAVKGVMTGMLGVYLTAAELTKRGFIVSPTSRSAKGADLLVTDQRCENAWSVQVKTNRKMAGFWLLGAHASEIQSDSHIYIFVNLRGEARPEYYVVPSKFVASNIQVDGRKTGSVWYGFHKKLATKYLEGWSIFGSPNEPVPDNDEEGTKAPGPE
jgi:hypothetical protein